MTLYVVLAVALLGLLVYGFSSNPKAAEVGRTACAFGLLVFLWQIVGQKVFTAVR